MEARLTTEDCKDLRESHYLLQITNRRALLRSVHSHDFYEIIYLLDGQCTEKINDVDFLLRQDDVTILRPNDTHAFTSQSADANLLGLSVAEPEMRKFVEAYGLEKMLGQPPFFTLALEQRYALLAEYEKLATMEPSRRGARYKIILGLFVHFFLSKAEISLGESPPDMFLRRISEIHSFENIAAGVPALVRLSGFSPAQLGRLMKQHFGVTPHQYIFRLRMDAAYELVRNSSLALETISEKVGYGSFSHFNQIFKRCFKISPAKLRKQSELRTV